MELESISASQVGSTVHLSAQVDQWDKQLKHHLRQQSIEILNYELDDYNSLIGVFWEITGRV